MFGHLLPGGTDRGAQRGGPLCCGGGERRVARPPPGFLEQREVAFAVHRRVERFLPLHLLGEQLLLGPGRDRAEHQLLGQLGDRGGEPCALHLAVPDLTEQARIPGQFGVEGLRPAGVEAAGEDAEGAG